MSDSNQIVTDVAIIGGGPGGATTASILKTHRPGIDVLVLERERFPREHIGESQLPPVAAVLEEMQCWDKVEAAGFPIKMGVTFRWGHSPLLWDFDLVPMADYRDVPRPRKLEGQARQLALQVERSIYDQILLDHAQSQGVRVMQETPVSSVEHDGDRITGLRLNDGRRVLAKHYVDASGNAAVIRKAMGVKIEAPTRLQNIAFWDYWDNPEWTHQFPSRATRVLILSIGCGWIWYIPIGATRTSIGFVCPAEYYKRGDRSPAELYAWALQQEPLIRELTANATRDGKVQATRDWSYLSERATGDNWMLVGEACGFADPILSAGLTLTQTGAREAAYTILALDDGEHDAAWLRGHYAATQLARIRQHIRFADYWYSCNGVFTDLQEFTREIAADAGLDLDARDAFRWLGTGGFTNDIPGQVGIGGLDLAGARQAALRLRPEDADWQLSKVNEFRLDLAGATRETVPVYENGRIRAVDCYVRGKKRLIAYRYFATLIEHLQREHDISRLLQALGSSLPSEPGAHYSPMTMQHLLQALEVMLNDGWVVGTLNPQRPCLELGSPYEGRMIHTNRDLNPRTGAAAKVPA